MPMRHSCKDERLWFWAVGAEDYTKSDAKSNTADTNAYVDARPNTKPHAQSDRNAYVDASSNTEPHS